MPELSLVSDDVRVMRVRDLPHALIMFGLTYGEHDRLQTRFWFEERLKRPDFRFLMSPDRNRALVGCVSNTFYWPDKLQCYSLFLFGNEKAANPWQSMKLLRSLISWGRTKGARRFHLSSELGQADLTPLALRLGMTRDMPHFVMEL